MGMSLQEKRDLPRLLQTPKGQALLQLLSVQQRAQLKFDWTVWAREKQLAELLPRQDWTHWLILAGRGFGKTRTGAEWVRMQMESGNMKRIALIARTPADARAVMIEGDSGIMNICPPWARPEYEPSKLRLTWPNGSQCEVYSAEKPDKLRGPQHDGYWCDELAAWRFVQETWDNLLMGLRLFPLDGRPRGIITTTPRPIPLIRELVETWQDDEAWHDALLHFNDPDPEVAFEAQQSVIKIQKKRTKKSGQVPTKPTDEVWITTGSTLENANNWPKSQLRRLLDKYQGTRLGRQELDAEILNDSPGSLWRRELLDDILVQKLPPMARIVVAVDPQKMHYGATAKKHNDETGIVVCGRSHEGFGFVLADRSCDLKPEGWAKRAVDAWVEFKADAIVAESNAGGQMVEAVIQAEARARGLFITVILVHATKGKLIRAEPISTMYERRKIYHWDTFPELEDQMCTWDPNLDGDSPDRVDALVWGLTDLLVDRGWEDDKEFYSIGGARTGW